MTISTTTLKNAAKAIGYDLWSDPDGSHYLVDYDGVKLKRWDPEHSSADSFELMVSLALDVKCSKGWAVVEINEAHRKCIKASDVGGDIFMATRLAILKAANHIGENL